MSAGCSAILAAETSDGHWRFSINQDSTQNGQKDFTDGTCRGEAYIIPESMSTDFAGTDHRNFDASSDRSRHCQKAARIDNE